MTWKRLQDFTITSGRQVEKQVACRARASATRYVGDKEFWIFQKTGAGWLLGLKNIPVQVRAMIFRIWADVKLWQYGGLYEWCERSWNTTEFRWAKTTILEICMRWFLGDGDEMSKAGAVQICCCDGGKGQLSAAIKARDERGINCRLLCIAKREEEIIIHKTGSQIGMSYIEELQKSVHPGYCYSRI